MQTGTIVQISPRGTMFIVQIDGGDFAAFELRDSIVLHIGECITGKLNAVQSEELLHLGQGKVFSVYGETGPSSLKACQRLIASK